MRITLVEYNPDWPKLFEKERSLLLRTLEDSVAKIKHIGSTAVPGLVSKPIIDIMVGLHDFSIADSLVPKIVNLGYTYFPEFEDVMPNRRFFKKLIDGTTTHHIHMTEIDSEFWQRHLLFRNYLRGNPKTAEEYASLKKELAKQDWEDSNDFAEAKSEFIKNIETKASMFMWRKDKQIKDIAAVEDILDSATVCRLGLCENNQPYVVPLCFGYKDDALYFHCASQGKKLDILRKNNNVCFEVDIDHELIKADQPCDWGMKFKSAIGFGKATFVEETELKREALDIIMQNYSNKAFEYPAEAVKNIIIVKVEIENMTGKKSGG